MPAWLSGSIQYCASSIQCGAADIQCNWNPVHPFARFPGFPGVDLLALPVRSVADTVSHSRPIGERLEGMSLEVFLKSGIDVEAGAESQPPYILHFEMESANVRYARDKARLLLKAVDRNAGRDFANDTARAEYLLADTLAANAHTDPGVMQVLAFILVFLCSETPEALAALVTGRVAKVGYLLTPHEDAEPPGAESPVDSGKLFRFRRVEVER
ncbi:hypothetical protein CCP1ISM_1010003 [Azospirillaceae bacterium]